VLRLDLPADGVAAARTCLAARGPSGEPERIRAVAARCAAFAGELRLVSRELLDVGLTEAWAGTAQAAFLEQLRAGAPTFDHTAARYEDYSAALNRYAGELDQSLWALLGSRRELQARLDSVGTAGVRQVAGTSAVAVSDQAAALLPAARRFQYAYDRWADAVERCSTALLRANSSDPLRDRHGLRAAGHAIKAAATLQNISHALAEAGSALSMIGQALLPLCPQLAGAVLLAATVVAAAQLCVDLARRQRGENVPLLALATEAMAVLPGGRLAGRSATVVEHEVLGGEHTVTRLVPGGGLIAHEGINGSHTIAKHVGKSVKYLRARLAAEPRKRVVSTFTSRSEAESSISDALHSNAGEVEEWLMSPKYGKEIVHRMDSPIGMMLSRDSGETFQGMGVKVVLRKDAMFPSGYRIQTAFVIV
jgi:uncharacterized protein YukE